MTWIAYLYKDGKKVKTEVFSAKNHTEAEKIMNDRRGCLEFKIIESFSSFLEALHWIKENDK